NHGVVDAAALQRFCTQVLENSGLLPEHAETVSRNLVDADLRGISSHGVSRLRYYVEKIRSGGFNVRPQLHIVREGPAYAVVDADNAPGAVAGVYAMDLCTRKARESGVALVTVFGGNHYGYAGFYSKRAIEQDMIGFSGCNTPAKVAVHGGADSVLGTNPFSYAVPADCAQPLLFDGATSVVARGKLLRAFMTGEPIEEGWAIDAEGFPARNAEDALAGSLLTFGEHKGSGLSILIEVLSVLLSGAELSVNSGEIFSDPARPQKIGFFFGAIDIGHFADPAQFKRRVDTLSGVLRSGRHRDGCEEILMPGEIETRNELRQHASGIAIAFDVWNELCAFQRELEIDDGPFRVGSAFQECEL
ncbi:MAG TPA: Ldh family oxidoreductase, partial [Spirochaetia bacterium]|nr:Ldh family oxidoreductase [Spirochaetia bacterium]